MPRDLGYHGGPAGTAAPEVTATSAAAEVTASREESLMEAIPFVLWLLQRVWEHLQTDCSSILRLPVWRFVPTLFLFPGSE